MSRVQLRQWSIISTVVLMASLTGPAQVQIIEADPLRMPMRAERKEI